MSFDSTDRLESVDDATNGSDLPPEAAGRLGRAAFSSGLTVPDFAACLHMGMRPVGLVQGFCVMRWSWYGASTMNPSGPYYSYGTRRNSGTTLSTYRCPHGYATAEHRSYGSNFEQPWVTKAWAEGFNKAYKRMIEEAADAGAHGVVGIHDSNTNLIDADIREFHSLVLRLSWRANPNPSGSGPLPGRPATGQVDGGRVHAGVDPRLYDRRASVGGLPRWKP